MRAAILGLIVGMTIPGAGFADAKKEAACAFQAQLLGQVQAARLDRVRKDEVAETLLEANPEWPDAVQTALPAVVEYVWGFKRRDLKKIDLAADAETTCLENYEQIKALGSSVSN